MAGPVVALGEERRLLAYALAAVEVIAAESPAEVAAGWERLPAETALLLLTPMAAHALADRISERPRLLRAVLPA
jgi:hypothetical protein